MANEKIKSTEIIKDEQLESVVGGANLNVEMFRKLYEDEKLNANEAKVTHFPTTWTPYNG